MAVIRPFRGLRPKPQAAKEVASPPYDVLSSDEARAIVKVNPSSFLRVTKPEVDLAPGVDLYSEQVYAKGRENLERFTRDGLLVRDAGPCLYLYRLTMAGRSQTGLVTLTSVAEYNQGRIKKHEHTRPDKVKDRGRHITTCNAQTGPVFSIFRHNAELDGLFRRLTASSPDVDFESGDGIRHELWVIGRTADMDALVGGFGRLSELYIADGHHRSEAASEVCRQLKEANPRHTGDEIYNYFLNVVFPDNELRILPYNRVVKDLGALTPAQMLERASEKFRVSPARREVVPEKPHQVGLYCEKKWYLLESREGTYDAEHPCHSLDSAVLTANFLDPILGIANIRTDQRIDFVGGIRGTAELVRLVDSGKHKVAFSLYPVSVEQLLKVADAGQVMPPKSTWFEPKLRDAMVINLLEA